MSFLVASPPRPGPPAGRDDRFPPGIPYIVGNEGAERFSFYGMSQILYVYLAGLFSGFVAENAIPAAAKVHATQINHLFIAGVYLFPMIGAILADRLLGKYRVIFWISLIYVAGHAALAIGGRFGTLGNLGAAEFAMFTGLTLIAIGSGGIKPCVSANVGDQFTAANSHLVTRVFQVFYFIINFGSFFASVLTPFLYQRVGPEVAFGVPGILMALATIVFWAGRRKFVHVPPQPGGALGALDFVASSLMAVPLLVFIAGGATVAESLVGAAMSKEPGAMAIAWGGLARDYWPYAAGSLAALLAGLGLFARRQRLQADAGFLSVLVHCVRHRGERGPGDDFWAPARRRFGDEAAEGPPAVLRIVVVFSMVSVFWGLYYQYSSTWIEQAKAMGRTVTLPVWLWNDWFIPAGIASALFGLLWIVRWVSNRPPTRFVVGLFLVAIGLWGAGAGVLQWLKGGTFVLEMLPAQISALNPLLVMIIIPLLNVAVYRPLERRGRPMPPLRRMTIGMFLAALSFVAVALLQARIQAAGRGEVHVLWQIIPYTLVTAAEVLVSVTGLEFAYTQAPRKMKSTIMSFWLLCITFGNVLVAFLAPLETLSLAKFFWLFAGLMAAAATVFALLAARYRGRSYLQPA